MSKREMEEYERIGMVDSIQCRREGPTYYRAPETDQKWRARNVISFHFRHFAYKAPPAYRDVLLCAIDHANPTTGRCDVGQRKIARECNLTRQTVNEAMRWWEDNTCFLQIENRPGRTNAYHIQWRNLETDWRSIQDRIGVASPWRHSGTEGGVSAQTRHPVSAQTRQGGVGTDPTLNIKKNLKEEPHPEWAHPPSACDATHSESHFFDGETQPPSERVESQQRHSEEDRVTLTPDGLTASRRYGVIFWTDALKGAEAELKHCTLPKRRKELEDKIADCRKRIGELQHEQRDETAGTGFSRGSALLVAGEMQEVAPKRPYGPRG